MRKMYADNSQFSQSVSQEEPTNFLPRLDSNSSFESALQSPLLPPVESGSDLLANPPPLARPLHERKRSISCGHFGNTPMVKPIQPIKSPTEGFFTKITNFFKF